MTDPISDMIIRIKNAQALRKAEIIMPASKVKEQIAKVLSDTGYIGGVHREAGKPVDTLVITLKYQGSEPMIHHLQRFSKPGLRQYRSTAKFPRPLSGHGLVIVSTTKGIMSNQAAQKAGIGGEIIATVW